MTLTGFPAGFVMFLIAACFLSGAALGTWALVQLLFMICESINKRLQVSQIVLGIYFRRLRRKKLAPNSRGMCAACFFEDTHQVDGVERVVDERAHTCEIGQITEPNLDRHEVVIGPRMAGDVEKFKEARDRLFFSRLEPEKAEGWPEFDDPTPIESFMAPPAFRKPSVTQPIVLRPIRKATEPGGFGTSTVTGKLSS